MSYHDPYVPRLREFGLESVAARPRHRRRSDCVVIVTDHTSIDYADLVERAQLVVDFRNATGRRPAARTARSSSCDASASASSASATGGRTSCATWPAWPSSRGAATSPRRTARATRRSTRRPRFTADFDDLLNDPSLDAIAVASSVPTHHPLGMRALAAGKHVFIEKPLAASVADARELVAAAEAADRRLMVGHLLLFHPALAAVRELIDSGELGDIYYLYGNRVNLGKVRADENALWSLGAHDVAVLLDLVGERPDRGAGARRVLRAAERRGRRLRLPQVPVRRRRPPAPELARSAQDAQADRRRLAEDGRLRRHGDRPQGHDLRQERLARRRAPTPTASTSACASATSPSRASRTTSRCASSARSSSMRSARTASRAAAAARAWRWSRCSRRCSRRSTTAGSPVTAAGMTLRPDPRGPNLHVGDDVTIGDGVEFGANVVVHDGCSIGAGHGRRGQRRARQAPGARRPARRHGATRCPGLHARRGLHDLDRRDRVRRLDARRRA